MKPKRLVIQFITLFALVVLPSVAIAQERQTFTREDVERAKRVASQGDGSNAHASQPNIPGMLGCRGPISQVIDVGDENLRFTSADYFTNPGGGEGAGFDKTPLLSTKVQLAQGACLDAHLSAIVGSRQAYGVASLAMFQVTLTSASGAMRHMVGHYHTPFGRPSPAIALEAERDVDMLGSNFFQRVGTGPHEVPPGVYRVDVWWAGAGPGGAIGAAFILKLYTR
jgi:hypothetical protein